MGCNLCFPFLFYSALLEFLKDFVVEVHEGSEADLRKELAGVRRTEITARKAEKDDKATFNEKQKKPEWIANNWHKFNSEEDGNQMQYPWCFIKNDDGSYTYVGGYESVQSVIEREQVDNIFGGCQKK